MDQTTHLNRADGDGTKVKLAASLIALMLCGPLGAEEKRRSLWRVSVAALLGAAAADVHTSLGRPEANPLLRGPGGRFDGRGVAIKCGVGGAAIAAQWLILRRQPRAEPYAAAANFATASFVAGAAVRNHVTRPGTKPPP